MKLVRLVFILSLLACFTNGVAQTLQANFTHSINRLAPLRVSFTDLSTPMGEISFWNWDFGDGTAIETAANPSHLYSFSGEYTVKLTVKRGTEQNIYSKKITVSTELNAIFSKSASSGLPPLTVNLDASASTGFITEQLWVISPSTGFTYVSGNSGSVKASVKFTTGGVYNVSLRLTDGSRIIESAKQTITVKNQPVVDFDWPKPVYVGRQIQFTDRTQFPCVTGISHLWTFPSSPVNSSAQNPVFTFTAAGTWDVKLCVTDGCGNNVCINKKVEVLTPTTNVFAQFTSSKISVMKGETVDFYDTTTPRDDIKTWIWNFELPKDFPIPQNYTDAGNVVADKAYFSYQEKASHQFNTAGTFKVRLGVEGAYNPSGPIPRTFFEQIIEVREIPVLKSGKQAQYTDNFMSDNVYATSNSRAEALALAVLRKNGATSSSVRLLVVVVCTIILLSLIF